MKQTWVVVADSTRARIMSADHVNGSLRELETLVHPESRLHEKDLTTDLPGRTFDSGGQGRHAMEQTLTPKQQERADFARNLADRLEEARSQGNLRQLIIVASPSVLGELRKSLTPELERLVVYELDKNVVQNDVKDIRNRLPGRLPSLAH